LVIAITRLRAVARFATTLARFANDLTDCAA
jgi:hypothetical protein